MLVTVLIVMMEVDMMLALLSGRPKMASLKKTKTLWKDFKMGENKEAHAKRNEIINELIMSLIKWH